MSTPDIRGGLDLKQFESEDHAVLGAGGSGHLIIDQELARRGIGRRVALTIPNSLGAAFVIERTDLLMTIPRRLAEPMRRGGEFGVFPLPFPIPKRVVKQQWYQGNHHDPGNRRLRGQISELVAEAIGTPPATGATP